MKKMKNKNIAIFGSNSHIAKGLIFYYLQEKGYYLHLFSQHPDKVRKFLNSMSKETKPRYFVHSGYRNIMKYSYDMIISCVGAGTLNKHKGDYTKYFTVTEKFDNLALAYLKEISGKTKYICFSSGAIYGGKCSSPAKDNTLNYINVNHVAPSEYYSIVRLNSEAKHRAFKNLNIIDLRVFSYFSRFADLRDGYFITDLMNCILRKKVLLTDRNNIIRDFVHPKDLFMAIKKCESKKMINAAFDISSSKPISKKEILDYFSRESGLKYRVCRVLKNAGATGAKKTYYSKFKRAENIGYRPVFSSMDTIKLESRSLLEDLTGEK